LAEFILAIDPSINKTGWSLFDLDKRSLRSYGTWSTGGTSKDNLVDRMETLRKIIREVEFPGGRNIIHIVIEFPDSWVRKGKKGAGANNVSNLLKLSFAAGWYAGKLPEILSYVGVVKSTRTVQVSEWKGRDSKAKTEQMIRGLFGGRLPNKMNDHEADSIGLALWCEARMRLERAIV